MIEMKIDLKGRINNIELRTSYCLWPLFEAIINSFQALEERGNYESGFVKIRLIRDDSPSLPLDDKSNLPITGFEVEDNGLGFTKSNFDSFNTSDTTYKIKKGGKGIGRFLWLKAFDIVKINSVFKENGKNVFFKRDFDFSIEDNGSSNNEVEEFQTGECKTIVKLLNFKEIYRNICPKKTETIGEKIISHFLSYFVLKNLPAFSLIDGEKELDLKELFEKEIHKYTQKEQFDLKNNDFNIIHTRRYSPQERRHLIYYCAIDREVTSDNLQKFIPDLRKKICDSEGNEFFYIMYVTGKYLDERVNNERTDFNILKEDEENLFAKTEISKKELEEKVIEYACEYLKLYLGPIREEKSKQIESFIHKNPRFRPLLADKDELLKNIPPGLSDQKMELELFKQYRTSEEKLMKESQEFIRTDLKEIKDIKEYHEKSDYYFKKINDFGKSNLAQYITHRHIMLILLEKSLKWDVTKKYEYEKVIHNMIFPLKRTSDNIDYNQQNLWIIDEKLSYHQYLASDTELSKMEPLENESDERPDLIIFNKPIAFVEDDQPFQSIVIIEFKRPGKTDYNEETNPITQIFNYIKQIRDGKARTGDGRPILIPDNVPFYCYSICDKSPRIDEYAQQAGFTKSPDQMGYFGYNPNYKAYIEVLSYTKLINDAKKRNKVLFDYLFQTSPQVL